MSDAEFSDDELMAYADGELAEARASEIDLALTGDAALAQRLALFVDTRASMSRALAPMLDQPVPDALLRQVQEMARKSDAAQGQQTSHEDTVVAFQPKPETRAKSAATNRLPAWRMALAASIAMAIGLGAGLFLGGLGSDEPVSGIQIAALQDPGIIDALSTMPAGESRVLDNGSRIAIIASFLDDSGAVCREFEYDQTGGQTFVLVSCFETDWDIRFAVAAAPANDTGYAPASSLAALDAYLQATGAQAPLSAEDEAQILLQRIHAN